MRVTAKAGQNREVEQHSYIYVSGRTDLNSEGGERKTVQIIADKKTYRPGDTARLLIVTGKANTPVLVSIEGRDLRSHRILRSPDGTAILEVPVTAQDEPGGRVDGRGDISIGRV